MANTFKGTIKNEIRPENGTNISIKGLEDDRIILQGHTAHNFEKKQDGKTLKLIIRPSSGGTGDPRSLKAEVKNATEKTNTTPEQWEVEITASAPAKPAEITITFEESLQ